MAWEQSTTHAAEGRQLPVGPNDDKRKRNHHGQFSGRTLPEWAAEGIGDGTVTVAGGHLTFINLRA
jgi:hypothetical protein